MRWKPIFNRLWVISLFVFSLLITSCDLKPTTMGYQHRLFVVADSVTWVKVEPLIREAFEMTVPTPLEEKEFVVSHITLDQLNSVRTRMNIVFIGLAEGKGETDQYLQKYLPQTFKEGVADGKYLYLFNDDMFARDQIGIIFFAQNIPGFRKQFPLIQEEMLKIFKKKYYARLKKGMFEKGENTKLEEMLKKYYGWSVRVQHDYFIALQDLDAHYVWLRRISPDRWVSIWENQNTTDTLSMEAIITLRNKMARQYYQGDVVDSDDLKIEKVDFEGHPAQKMSGLWRNDSLLVGGPFRLYTWFDTNTQKRYCIDIAVRAPSKKKKPYLDQLEVIAHTFALAKQEDAKH